MDREGQRHTFEGTEIEGNDRLPTCRETGSWFVCLCVHLYVYAQDRSRDTIEVTPV